MSKKTAVIMPKTREILEQMGEQIRLARLRRKLSSQLVAERAHGPAERLCGGQQQCGFAATLLHKVPEDGGHQQQEQI